MQWHWLCYHLSSRWVTSTRYQRQQLISLAFAAVGGWFDERRATAFGVLSTGSGLGGVIFPIMVTRLIQDVGFGWAMRISTFIITLLLAIANLTVKCNVPPTTSHSQNRQKLASPFKEVGMILVCVGYMLLTFGIFVPVNYMIVQARSVGMSLTLSNYLPSLYNGVRSVDHSRI